MLFNLILSEKKMEILNKSLLFLTSDDTVMGKVRFCIIHKKKSP